MFRAGFCNCFTDVDIFIDNINFNEKSFLEFDSMIEVVPNEDYINVSTFLKKRFGVTVVDSDGESYRIDFVLMDFGVTIDNNYLFSEYVTGGFDIDICRLSIVAVDEEYRLIFNSHFKVFIRNETQCYKNYYDERTMPMRTFQRFLKYESRLKCCYRLFYTNCAPSFDFDHLMKFRQLNMNW